MEPPVIDAKGLLSPDSDSAPPPAEVAQQIVEASRTLGFFQLVNHGFPQELLDSTQAVMRAFFALPRDVKQKVKRTRANPYGWFDDELTKQTLDLKEGFDFCHEIGAELPGFMAPNQWPEGQDEFRAVMERCLQEMARASFKLTEALCLGLNMPAGELRPLFQDTHTSFMRLNYYPVVPQEGALGINHHTDAGFLTLLVQDDEVPGLQFFRQGQWHTVTPVPGALTCNVGDQAQVLSNDLIQAPLHRVLSPHAKPRLSAPMFFNPRPDALIAPLPACVAASGAPPRYRPISWREFRERRFAGDYADVGEEVQISHYRI